MTMQNTLNLEVAPQSTLKDKAVSKALEMLRNMGTHYIVRDESGVTHTHGDPIKKVKATKGQRNRNNEPYGTFTAHVKKQGLLDMYIGDVLLIDAAGLDIKRVRGVCSSLAGKVWGNESVMTTINKGKVEILRLK